MSSEPHATTGLRAWMAIPRQGLSTPWFGDMQPGAPSFLMLLGSSPLSQGRGRDREKLLWPRLPERVYRPQPRARGQSSISRPHVSALCSRVPRWPARLTSLLCLLLFPTSPPGSCSSLGCCVRGRHRALADPCFRKARVSETFCELSERTCSLPCLTRACAKYGCGLS